MVKLKLQWKTPKCFALELLDFSMTISSLIRFLLISFAESTNDLNVPGLGTDDSDDNRSSCDYQTCNISDFFISEMIITNLPFDGSTVVNDFTDANPFHDFKRAEPSMFFDVAEECMMLPFLEETAKVSYSDDMNSCEEAMIDSNNSSLHLAINQIRSSDQESDLNIDLDQAEDFDQSVIKNLPELSDVVSNFRPSIHPKESCRRKSITLVLDLDGQKLMLFMSCY